MDRPTDSWSTVVTRRLSTRCEDADRTDAAAAAAAAKIVWTSDRSTHGLRFRNSLNTVNLMTKSCLLKLWIEKLIICFCENLFNI